MSEKTNVLQVDTIVAQRDKQPYLRIFAQGKQIGQFTIADARNIAADIQQQAARAEADAMILKFFDKQEYPKGAAEALLIEFRDLRMSLDREPVERSFSDPETGAKL